MPRLYRSVSILPCERDLVSPRTSSAKQQTGYISLRSSSYMYMNVWGLGTCGAVVFGSTPACVLDLACFDACGRPSAWLDVAGLPATHTRVPPPGRLRWTRNVETRTENMNNTYSSICSYSCVLQSFGSLELKCIRICAVNVDAPADTI